MKEEITIQLRKKKKRRSIVIAVVCVIVTAAASAAVLGYQWYKGKADAGLPDRKQQRPWIWMWGRLF